MERCQAATRSTMSLPSLSRPMCRHAVLRAGLYGRSCAPCAHSQAKSVQTARPSSKAGNSEPGSGSSKGPAPTQEEASSSGQDDVDNLLLRSLEAEASLDEEGSGGRGALFAGIGLAAGIALLLGGGYVFREPIKHFLTFFIDAVDEWGPLGYLAYAAVYTGLEVLAVPAIPLTMTAGVIFGPLAGTAVVSLSGTLAATIAFLIARYAARDKVATLARRNKRWASIDRAISRNGFKFVMLLRLSPLLPLAVSNYLYGLTSVDLGAYVAGSWLGMLPGTYAYVTAGHVGKAVLTAGEGGGGLNMDTWHVGLALGATVLALGFVGRLAQQAVEEADREALAEAAAEAAAKAAAKAGPGQAPPAVAQHSLKYGNGSKPPPSSSL